MSVNGAQEERRTNINVNHGCARARREELFALPLVALLILIAVLAAIIHRKEGWTFRMGGLRTERTHPSLFTRESGARRLGERGERFVGDYLDTLDSSEYRVLNDIVIGGGGKTTQIDHVVICKRGVFVIETKNYDGWIYGRECDEEWTQVFFKRKHRFYNPLLQNAGHIRALRHLLSPMGDIPIHSVVAFTGESTLKVSTALGNVVKERQLLAHIQTSGSECLSADMRDEVFGKIASANRGGRLARLEHVDFAIERKKEAKRAVLSGVCPRCGGTLLQRNGKFGPFVGCTNYRNGCRFTTKQN